MVNTWILSTVSVPIILIMFSFRRQQVAEIVKRITRIIQFSTFLNQETDDFIGKALSSSFYLLLIIITLSSLSESATLYKTAVYSYFENRFAFLIHDIVYRGCILQYTFLLLFLAREFEVLNETLLKINKEHTDLKDSDIKSINQRDQIVSDSKLENLYNLYLQLYKLSHEVSEFYSLPIFLCIFHLFISIVNVVYYLVQSLYTKAENLDLPLLIKYYIDAIIMIILILQLNSAASFVIIEVSNCLSI